MLKHKTIPAGVDQPGFTGVTPSLYAEEHLFSGGTHGALMYRDTGASDGSGWVTSAPGVCISAGSLEIPSFSQTLPTAVMDNITRLGTITTATTFTSTVTAATLIVGGAATITTLGVTGVTTLGGSLGVTGAVTMSSTLAVTTSVTIGSGVIRPLSDAGFNIRTTVGSVYDFTLTNPANSAHIFAVATGTLNVGFAAAVSVATTLTVTSTINGQTISAAANFTGSVAVATTLNVTGNVGLGALLFVVGATTLNSTLAVTGESTLTAGVRSSTVTGAMASGVATTAVALTSGDLATYIVRASLGGPVNDPTNYAAVSIICVDGTAAVITSLETAPLMVISLSGLNVQVTQTSGSLNTVKVVVLRIA